MKAGQRWNFLCHSGTRRTDRSRHLLHLNPPTRERTAPNKLSRRLGSPRPPSPAPQPGPVYPNLTCHLSTMTKCWQTWAQRCLGPERSSPLSGAQAKQTQACTKASHKPQPTSQFPLCVPFFFLLLQIHINTYTYMRKPRENVHAAEYSKKWTTFTILSDLSRFPDGLLFPRLPERRPACLLWCPSQSELYWSRTDRIEPGD